MADFFPDDLNRFSFYTLLFGSGFDLRTFTITSLSKIA